MSDSKVIVDQELVNYYARVKNVSLEEARQRLEENLVKEASVDLRQQMTTLMNAFRKMSPQLQGVVSREIDYSTGIKNLQNQISDLNAKLELHKAVFARAVGILESIVEEDKKTLARIAILEATRLPFYKRIYNRIKCLLNR